MTEERLPRVAVVGSRTFTDEWLLTETLNAVRARLGPFVLVSGGARGADKLAAQWARRRLLGVLEFLPDYAGHGRAAPLRRNEQIVVQADELVAFWDGQSSGTAHTLRLAAEKGIPVTLVRFEK